MQDATPQRITEANHLGGKKATFTSFLASSSSCPAHEE